MDQVLNIFLQEAWDLADELDAILLEIENSPGNEEILEQFMRKMHSLKGTSATVGLDSLSNLSHDIEDIILFLRNGHLSSSPDFFDILSISMDVISRALTELGKSGQEPFEVEKHREDIALWLENNLGEEVTKRSLTPTEKAGDLVLGEYDVIRIRALQELEQHIYRLDVSVTEPERSPAEVARERLEAIREVGEPVATVPEEWDFEEAEFSGVLKVVLAAGDELQTVSDSLADAGIIPFLFEELGLTDLEADDETAPDLPVSIVTDKTVRVERRHLDELMRLVGELVTARARFHSIAGSFRQVLRDNTAALDIDEAATGLGQIASELQTGIMHARMVPVSRLFRQMKRRVRKAARESGISLRLVTDGEQTEIDKGVLDHLGSPLGDLIYSTALNLSDPEVPLSLTAEGKGNQVALKIFSIDAYPNKDVVDEVSSQLSASGGRLDFIERIEGYESTIHLPTTLAIFPVMMVMVDEAYFAIPLEDVRETLSIQRDDITTISTKETIDLRGEALSLLNLSEYMSAGDRDGPNREFIVVVRSRGHDIGIIVDKLLGKQDIVIKPLGRRFHSVTLFQGATILGDGSVALVLNVDPLSDTGNQGQRSKSSDHLREMTLP